MIITFKWQNIITILNTKLKQWTYLAHREIIGFFYNNQNGDIYFTIGNKLKINFMHLVIKNLFHKIYILTIKYETKTNKLALHITTPFRLPKSTIDWFGLALKLFWYGNTEQLRWRNILIFLFIFRIKK